jgi:hypothetical protein
MSLFDFKIRVKTVDTVETIRLTAQRMKVTDGIAYFITNDGGAYRYCCSVHSLLDTYDEPHQPSAVEFVEATKKIEHNNLNNVLPQEHK